MCSDDALYPQHAVFVSITYLASEVVSDEYVALAHHGGDGRLLVVLLERDHTGQLEGAGHRADEQIAVLRDDDRLPGEHRPKGVLPAPHGQRYVRQRCIVRIQDQRR